MAEETKETKAPKESPEVAEGKVWGILAYLGIFCLLPLLLKMDNKFAAHHAKQGLILFIAEIIAILIFPVPIIGQIIFAVAYVAFAIYIIAGIIKSLQGEYWRAPVIADWADKIKI